MFPFPWAPPARGGPRLGRVRTPCFPSCFTCTRPAYLCLLSSILPSLYRLLRTYFRRLLHASFFRWLFRTCRYFMLARTPALTLPIKGGLGLGEGA